MGTNFIKLTIFNYTIHIVYRNVITLNNIILSTTYIILERLTWSIILFRIIYLFRETFKASILWYEVENYKINFGKMIYEMSLKFI